MKKFFLHRLPISRYPAHEIPVCRSTASQRGFTVIELMITLMIMGILLALAVPSFNSTIRDSRTLTEASSMVAVVANARSEALKRGRMVSICPSSNGTGCGADWSQGWIVYVEKPTVVAGGIPDVDTVILVAGAPKNLALTQASGNKWIRFTSRGLAEASVAVDVKPSVCNSGYKYQEIVFGITGRAAMTKKSC